MSLLRKPKFNTRWKKLLLVAVALLLLVPCVAAAAFAVRFEVDPYVQESVAQESVAQESVAQESVVRESVAQESVAQESVAQESVAQNQEQKEKEKEKQKLEMKAREDRVIEEMKERVIWDEEQNMREFLRKQELELSARSVMHAALVQLAKINMDQAIQIATSQQPGKVLMCSLGAKGWEAPGKLGKDGSVFYHVIIADETNPGTSTHVWVNAIDGTVTKTEKELPRKMRSPERN